MEYRRRELLGASAAGIAAAVGGCLGLGGDQSEGSITGEELALATTTSTYDTGLLDEINAAFQERFGTPVAANAQGTGAAIESARNGNADVILVHARSLEDEFMREGHGGQPAEPDVQRLRDRRAERRSGGRRRHRAGDGGLRGHRERARKRSSFRAETTPVRTRRNWRSGTNRAPSPAASGTRSSGAGWETR